MALNSDSVTAVARIDLSCGSVDALRAIHFLRRFPPHFHHTFAIGVVESGLTRLRTRRGEWLARPGTILAFSPGEVHSAAPLDAGGLTYRMIYPTIEFMRAIGIDVSRCTHGHPLFRAPVFDDPELAGELLQAQRPLMGREARRLGEDRLLASMRRLAQRHRIRDRDERFTGVRPGDVTIVERAQGYLHERFTAQVRLAAVADVCGVSPFTLIRMFRRVVGVPPYAYVVQLRINRAQAMLCEGSAIAEVAYSCGFSDQSHLTRTFKKAVGVPPGQYARSVRQSV